MRLSKIKTKEIRYVVWKYRLKRFLPHILTLCLAVIVAGGAFSAYSVYHKKVSSTLQLPCPSFLRGGFLFLSFSFIIES